MSEPDSDDRTFIARIRPTGLPVWTQIAGFHGANVPLWRWECSHSSHRWMRRSAWYDDQLDAIAGLRRHMARNHHA